MRIERLTPSQDPERVRACYRIYFDAARVDAPDAPFMPPRVFAGWLPHGYIGDPREIWTLTGSGSVAGWYALELPSRDNPHLAFVLPIVSPGRRRRGLGTALLRHAGERARASGRSLLTAFVWDDAAGVQFARAAGATPGVPAIHRVLDLAAIDAGRLADLRAEAERAAAGYSLVSWAGPTPGEYLDQVAAINRAMDDAPHDESWESLQWDGARVREAEKRLELQGIRGYAVAARRDATGELGGLTQVEVSPEQPHQAFQELTAVTRAHRGHRLGLLLKLAMLDWLAGAEPQVRQVFTENAEANKYMIAVNEALGYRVIAQPVRSWEIPVGKLLQS
jgi:GNAT superfamily N-acetyltransferase/RimJ/RimL family protein N-acetyltransferase